MHVCFVHDLRGLLSVHHGNLGMDSTQILRLGSKLLDLLGHLASFPITNFKDANSPTDNGNSHKREKEGKLQGDSTCSSFALTPLTPWNASSGREEWREGRREDGYCVF